MNKIITDGDEKMTSDKLGNKNVLFSEKELEELFNCTDLTKKIDPKLLNCKNWAKPGIASY